VMRYLSAELRQRQNILTLQQQEQLREYVRAMEPDDRPFVFNDVGPDNHPDPRREILDKYFREKDPSEEVPKLAEGMTPKLLLQQMIRIAANDDYPPPFEDMIGIIHDYQDRFDPNSVMRFIHTVLVSREEQLRTGSKADVAILGLAEILPHLNEQDPVYQAGWFAHLVDAGITLADDKPEEWSTSSELQGLMQQFLKGLGSAVFTDDEYYGVNYDALFALQPYLIDHLRQWPKTLPFGLGQDETFLYILRDLELIDAAKAEHDRKAHLNKVLAGLNKL
jgi:hypothetical protein